MRIAELHPVFDNGLLRFDCPLHNHKIVARIGPVAKDGEWTMSGPWPDVTVSPSINAACGFHQTITNGELT